MKRKYIFIILVFTNLYINSQNFKMDNITIKNHEQSYLIYIKAELESEMITYDKNGITTTLLIESVKNNYLSSVEYIFSKNSYKRIIDEPCDQYAPPLYWALKNGSKDITEVLLRNGANPNFKTKDNKNAFESIDECINSKQLTVLKANELKQMLLDYGYQLEEPNTIKVNDKLIVKENIRLRTVQGAGSIITTIQKGSPVKVKLLGKYEEIDGLKNRWFYVEVMDGAKDREGKTIQQGTSGWCYGGYLE